MRKLTKAIAVAAVAGLAATACSGETKNSGGSSAGEGDPFIFGSGGQVTTLDPVLTSDGETFRVTRQVYDTLLDHDGVEMVPGLAESWEGSDDGLDWHFKLRSDVTFHDGSELTGDVVCQNFDRWQTFEGEWEAVTYYWGNMFQGYGEESNYAGCEADGLDVTVSVKEASADYPGAFSMATFAILSPKSIEKIKDVELEDASEMPDYSQEVGSLAGTGPFKFDSWDHSSNEITLTRNDEYWGDKAGLETLIFKAIENEQTRRQALISGEIHGYDLVSPADVIELEKEGFNVPTRDVFNVLYLGFTEGNNPALAKPEVRQAIAHALDRERVVDTILPEGGKVATQFMPEGLNAWNPDVQTYEHDMDEAQDLVSSAGEDGTTLEFCYPTDVVRPYMPNVADIFEIFKANLEEAGFEVEPRAITWTDYVQEVHNAGCELNLLGWTGDFNEAFNFLGTWFDGYKEEWGFEDEEIFDLMSEARTEPDREKRDELLSEASALIMDYLPGVPISHSPPSIVFTDDVNAPTVSPLTQEDFAEMSWK
ncbi:ABC transporter substrate-binding protein [Haloglycomyces albus]|uniref:ABC transporter substrate-binding protein n=1 Tax=Haloglycomyces albus TaxID=526067 RepID=UPI00046D186A|nr:ABC transporter substrate-binding protein [Haloglycomyces albus]